MSDSTHVVYAVRAKHQNEALAHCTTRAEFLRHVLADPRTRDLFAWWGHSTGVDAIVDEMIEFLDAAALRAGLPHRSALRKHENAAHLIPILGVLQHREEQYERLLAETDEARKRFAVGFVVAELYGTVIDEEVPVRAWLANDLLTIFQLEIAHRVYGERPSLIVGLSPTLDVVKEGQRRKSAGEHLKRYAMWYYRARVKAPRDKVTQLAREWHEAQEKTGVFTSWRSKDRAGISDRPNTPTVRDGIKEAQRLLELTVPPELWDQFFKNTA